MQSVCTAVLTISGVRLAIGLTAFALAGSAYAPIHWLHQDAIRIPMLILAAVGAIADLLVLALIRHLQTQPSAQWRRREKTVKERRSQTLQVAVAVLTLLLVGLEAWSHAVMVHRAHAHAVAQIQKTTGPRNRFDRARLQPCEAWPGTGTILKEHGFSRPKTWPGTGTVLKGHGFSRPKTWPGTGTVLKGHGFSRPKTWPGTGIVLTGHGFSRAEAWPGTGTILKEHGFSRPETWPGTGTVLKGHGFSRAETWRQTDRL